MGFSILLYEIAKTLLLLRFIKRCPFNLKNIEAATVVRIVPAVKFNISFITRLCDVNPVIFTRLKDAKAKRVSITFSKS